MKPIAFAFVTLMLASTVVLAQPGGYLGVYTTADAAGDCALVEVPYTLQSVWVVHTAGPDIQAASFRVVSTWSATFINAVYPVLYLVEPDLFGGDSFGLGGCYVPPSVFAQLNFLSSVYSPPCVATISVAPDPDAASGEIEVVDCDGNALIAEPGGRVIINGNDGCLCWEPPVAAEQSTWGKVKALYR